MTAARRALSASADGDSPDARLVSAAAAGDADAFAELVRRHQRAVFSVARTCGIGHADAADVTQIVFTTLARDLHAIEHGQHVRSWLCTVARRQAWRVITRRDREDLGTPPDVAASDQTARVDDLVFLLDALDGLRQRCRDLLTALYLTEPPLDYQQVSESLEIAIGSIGPTRARCLEQLRERFGDGAEQ